MKFIIKTLLLSILTCSVFSDVPEEVKEKVIFNHFQNFLKAYNITYSSNDELQARLEIFKDNYLRLENKLKTKKQNHLSGITRFFDHTEQEFQKNHLSLNLPLQEVIKAQKFKGSFMERQNEDPDVNFRNLNISNHATENNNQTRLLQTSTIPASFDWRNYGVLSGVKNQGTCGSCWAFSTICVTEARYAMKYGVLPNLSEQQLINCDTYNNGCNGGNAGSAFYYLQYFSAGILKETDIPYTGVASSCNTSNKTPVAKISSYMTAGTKDEEYIKQMLYTYGPLSVSMNAKYLQYYKGGIITATATECNPSTLNHAVNLVGWGTENGIKFWIVRNTWSSSWGENGYFRIQRGTGTCGINQYVVTAFVK